MYLYTERYQALNLEVYFMTQENQLRQNPLPLPKSLKRRNRPKLNIQELDAEKIESKTRAIKPGPSEPRIVSSAHGSIKHILLCYPAYADGEYSYKQVYENLFIKLPKTTKFTILTHPSVSNDLKASLHEAKAYSRATIVEAPEFLNFLVWAEDPYVAVQDAANKSKTTFLVEPFTFTRVGDSAIAELVADATHVQSIQSPLYFQGGNLLIGDNFIFIGTDYPENTKNVIEQYGNIIVPEDVEIDAFIKDLYSQTFDPKRKLFYIGTDLPVPQYETRPIIINGEEWTEEIYLGTGDKQPIFHIDMFISLAGRNESGKYRLVVGSPTEADKILERSPSFHAMAEIFDDVASKLEGLGFEVIRNPLPLTYVDFPDIKYRSWYFATANNCLVQIDKCDGNHVWLPTYGHGAWADLAAVDAENKRIWEGLGFEVHELADFHPFAQNLGSVHCIKKYLER
ncbi:hypothetical protein NIES4071_65880 [Calothrix sp. NIES-4071]|nr:hypothetical protein NIES4071_65880 [Calothrix sp. NIES-4071]BAZ60892.1 hypothetical protein NIES4105_65840 [Calothrix sp. NIES-4105]